jgi:hypothetical protein
LWNTVGVRRPTSHRGCAARPWALIWNAFGVPTISPKGRGTQAPGSCNVPRGTCDRPPHSTRGKTPRTPKAFHIRAQGREAHPGTPRAVAPARPRQNTPYAEGVPHQSPGSRSAPRDSPGHPPRTPATRGHRPSAPAAKHPVRRRRSTSKPGVAKRTPGKRERRPLASRSQGTKSSCTITGFGYSDPPVS